MKSRWTVAALLCVFLIGTFLVMPPSVRGVSSTVVISEFRVRGPNGGSDEFVELYNLSGAAVNVGGWKIRGSNASGTVGDRATIPAGTMIPP
ncbi:MAG: lamin tail domain-containing protein, partial [Candidatus Acidiferrales bacterium]